MKLLKIATCSMAIAVSLAMPAFGADWKYHGNGDHLSCFFDAETVKKNADGNVQVWTKCLADKAMIQWDGDNDNFKKVHDMASQKVAGGYVPPYSKITSASNDYVLAHTALEEVANIGDVQPRLKVLEEIDCEKRMKRIRVFLWFDDGKITNQATKPTELEDIVPESKGETLLKLVCSSKQEPRQ
jgi:hypothetical protein